MKLRPFAAGDAAAVAALHARVEPASEWPSREAYAAYLREVLLHNPWVDPELPSWVCEQDGRIVGFLGVLPRRMRLGSRVLRVAVGCQMMVEPQCRASFAALELLRRFFAGPQDLSLADGANDASRALWDACGGTASALHSMHWVRLLRPAQGLLQLSADRLRGIATVALPFAALIDACTNASFKAQYAEEPLDAAGLHAALGELRHYTLRPDYDVASLEWLLAQARAKRRHGELQGALARDQTGRVAGWFLYYLNGAVSQVLQIGARRGALEAIVEQLCHHARQRGARALEGRMEPQLAAALQGKQCLMQARAIWTLLHARDQSLLLPLLRGDAFFSRLDGEWWMRFAGEPEAAASPRLSRFRTGLSSSHVGA